MCNKYFRAVFSLDTEPAEQWGDGDEHKKKEERKECAVMAYNQSYLLKFV